MFPYNPRGEIDCDRDELSVANRPTILYAGTYERDYPRNQQMIRLFGQRGWNVVEIHAPFWERIRDKSRLGGPGQLLMLLIQLMIAYLRIWYRYLMSLRTADAVMIGYIGQVDMLVLAPIARIVGKPVVFNPLVTLTDTIVEDRALARSDSIAARAIHLIDRGALKLASRVIVDTDQNAEYIISRFGVARHRIDTVFVGADEGVFRPGYRGSGRNGIHVLFYGKMIPLHGVEVILDAARKLQASGENDISFEIIGSGQQEHLVRAFVESEPSVSITHRSWVAYRRLPQRIACADVVLGIFGAGDKSGRVIPNKVFQAMAVGAPIITRDSPAIREILRDGESALMVPPGDPVALSDAILRLRDAAERDRLARGARTAFEQFGNDRASGRQLQAGLEQLLPDLKLDGSCG